MNHFAVAAAGLLTKAGMLLYQENGEGGGHACRERFCDGQSGHAGADNAQVEVIHVSAAPALERYDARSD